MKWYDYIQMAFLWPIIAVWDFFEKRKNPEQVGMIVMMYKLSLISLPRAKQMISEVVNDSI